MIFFDSVPVRANSPNYFSDPFLAFWSCGGLLLPLFQQGISFLIPHSQSRNQSLFLTVVAPYVPNIFGYFLQPFMLEPWRNLHSPLILCVAGISQPPLWDFPIIKHHWPVAISYWPLISSSTILFWKLLYNSILLFI